MMEMINGGNRDGAVCWVDGMGWMDGLDGLTGKLS